jgi:nucleotide-binding universal stress UspA family protein
MHMGEKQGPAPFRRAVLALNGGPTDELVVKLGASLARSGGRLVVIHVIEVDWTHELSEDVASTDERASATLDRAETICEKFGVPVETTLLQARDVGAALVDEAAEVDADLIILGLPFRKKFGGDFAIGRTVPYVFQNAPCAVLVVREPIAASAARGGEPQVSVGAGLGASDRL